MNKKQFIVRLGNLCSEYMSGSEVPDNLALVEGMCLQEAACAIVRFSRMLKRTDDRVEVLNDSVKRYKELVFQVAES